MAKFFKASDGQVWQAPLTRDESIAVNHPVYLVLNKCNDCKMSIHHLRYVDNDRCKSCVRREAYLTSFMVASLKGEDCEGLVDWENQTAWTELKTKNTVPWNVPGEVWERALFNAMLALGDPTIEVKQDACRRGGHVLVKQNGKCVICSNTKKKLSPRAQARQNGEKWYTPDHNCTACGTRAPKRVSNGACRGCNPTKEDMQKQIAQLREKL